MEVIGFPKYLVYPDGRVWSKGGKHHTARFLTPGIDQDGYEFFRLCSHYGSGQGIIKTFKCHRLVGLHYIPNPENHPVIDHIDRNTRNNHVSNLRWASLSTNRRNSRPRKNKSGHTYIQPIKTDAGYSWRFQMTHTQYPTRQFKSKTDCLCYKFIFLLKYKAGLI
jgi:hypothetical protein